MYEIRETLGDCCRQKGLGVLGDYGADLGDLHTGDSICPYPGRLVCRSRLNHRFELVVHRSGRLEVLLRHDRYERVTISQ